MDASECSLPLQRDAPHHSNWADMGGFLCGLLPAILSLPCPSDPRCASYSAQVHVLVSTL